MIPLQTGFTHPVSHVAFAPDGSAAAVAQPHAGVTVLERGTGRTLAVCHMPRRAELSGLTFTSCGRYLVAGHAKGLEAFDAATGAPVGSWLRWFHRGLKLAPRGDAVIGAGGTDYVIARPVCAVGAGGPVPLEEVPPVNRAHESAVAFAPDAGTVLVSQDARFVLVDAATGRTRARLKRPDGADEADAGPTIAAAFCPRGERLALNDGNVIEVYDTRAGPEPADGDDGDDPERAPPPRARIEAAFELRPDRAAEAPNWYPPFALLPDGRGLLVKRPRNRVQLWDAPTGAVQNEWSWRLEWVTCLAVSPDGLAAVAGGRFGRVLFWDLE